MRRICLRLLAVVLVIMLLIIPAQADDYDTVAMPTFSVIDESELENIVADFTEEFSLQTDAFSVGFKYIATGEEWYYNSEKTYYSASLYKVPLAMCVIDMVDAGEITLDTKIGSRTVNDWLEKTLVLSNNTAAHMLMDNLWDKNSDCRKLWPQYAGMSGEEFDDDFYKNSEFSAEFITHVMNTLYEQSDKYSLIIEYLSQAQPNQYIRHNLEGQYVIAQKYGSYEVYKNITGIVYRDNPVIITIMSDNVSHFEERSGTLAEMLVNLCDKLDERLNDKVEEYQTELAETVAEETENEASITETEPVQYTVENNTENESEYENNVSKAVDLSESIVNILDNTSEKGHIFPYSTIGIIGACATLILTVLLIVEKKIRNSVVDDNQNEADTDENSDSLE